MPHPCSRLTRLLRGARSQSGGAEVSTGDLAVCRWGAQRQAGAEDGERRLAGRGHFLPPASHLRGPSASEGGPVGPWPGLGAGRGGDSSLGHRWNPPHVSSQVEARATHRGGSRFCPGSQGPSCCPWTAGAPRGFRGDAVVSARGSRFSRDWPGVGPDTQDGKPLRWAAPRQAPLSPGPGGTGRLPHGGVSPTRRAGEPNTRRHLHNAIFTAGLMRDSAPETRTPRPAASRDAKASGSRAASRAAFRFTSHLPNAPTSDATPA